MEKIDELYLLWKDLKKSLRYEKRFFNNHEILSSIKEMTRQSEIEIASHETLYRARIFNSEVNFIDNFKSVINKGMDNYSPESDYEALRDTMNAIEFEKQYSTGFWGYDNTGCFVPEDSSIVNHGRANPRCVKYLYIADNPLGAIAEVRPLIGENINLAEISTSKSHKVVDLTYNLMSNVNENFKMLAYLIIDEFSKPNNGDEMEYLLTQYITEYIKSLGYDGIKYNSSLYKRGKNFVIFNYDEFHPKNSKIYRLDDVCHELSCVSPLGKMFNEDDLYHWKLEEHKKINQLNQKIE